MRYATRFVLPLGLLLGAVAMWFIAGSVGTPELQVASNATSSASSTPLTSVRRLPEFATQSLQRQTVAVALAALPAEPGGLSCTAVWIDGMPELQIRSDQALAPGYAQIFITGHAALDVLGPDFGFETRAMAEELPDENGRLFSDLYLVGGGDPVLMSPSYALSFRPVLSTRSPFEELSAAIVSAGVVRIDGSIIGVEDRYDDQRTVPGWPASYVDEGLMGPLSALQLDDAIATRAAANNGVAVGAESPPVFAADRFAQDLRVGQVEIFGGTRTLEPDEALPPLVPVARLASPPLTDIVFQMMAANDATAAEMLLKELGVARESVGSTQAGARVVQQVLRQQGVTIELPFRDGSGLDPVGGTSCDQLVATMDSIALDHPTIDALPAHDLPGVFGGRLADLELTSDVRLVGGGVGDASGFVARTVDQGRRVTIASIINRPGGPSAADLAYQQALVALADELRSSSTIDAIAVAE